MTHVMSMFQWMNEHVVLDYHIMKVHGTNFDSFDSGCVFNAKPHGVDIMYKILVLLL